MTEVIPDWELTPARATKLMTINRNRNLRPRHVAKLARDITTGRFRDHSVIKVANTEDGEVMIDGQHRCAAVILADTPVRVVLIKGLDLADQDVTDTGLTRTLSDVLKLRGEHNTAALGAALGWLWRHRQGMVVSDLSPSVNEALAILDENPGIRDTLTPVNPVARLLHISQGMCMFFYYQMAQMDQDSADDFWAKLESGADLGEMDPVFLLRRRLIQNANNRIMKLDRYMVAALIIKSWNAYVKGQQVQNLRWRRSGKAAEPFPMMEKPVFE